MKISFKKLFLKDITKVNEPQKSQVKAFIEELYINKESLENKYDSKKLKSSGKSRFFRLRFGDYRLGYEKKEDEIIFYRILHRKEIYRYFP